MSTNMEQWDLAPGEPISQDSNARVLSSQMLDCPSAPYNSEDPEYSETPVECTPGLPKASPLEESETCEDNEVAAQPNSISFQRHPIQSPLSVDLQENDADSHRKLSSVVSELVGTSDDTVMESSPKGINDGQNLFTCSEGLAVPDDSYGSMVSKGCCPQSLGDPKLSEEDKLSPMGSEDCFPRILGDPKLSEEDKLSPMGSEDCCPRILCDPKLLEEDTLSPMGVDDCCPRILCDPTLLEEDTQEDMQIYNPDLSDIPLPGKPLSLMIQDEILGKTSLTALQSVDRLPPANALSEAYSIPEDDIIRRWENRKRKALSETTNQSSHLETSSYNVIKKKPNQPVVLEMLEDARSQRDFAMRLTFDDKENCRMPIVSAGTSLPIPIPSSPDATQDVQCIDLTGDRVDVTISAQKPKRLRTSDLKSFWPQTTLDRENTRPEVLSGLVNPSTPEQQNAGGWVCPKSKKSGGKGRQRTMDSWIR